MEAEQAVAPKREAGAFLANHRVSQLPMCQLLQTTALLQLLPAEEEKVKAMAEEGEEEELVLGVVNLETSPVSPRHCARTRAPRHTTRCGA